jgi:hypothetical protein
MTNSTEQVLEYLTVAHLARSYPYFMETERSLPYLLAVTGPYSESVISNPHLFHI